jgi:hypothetical protein
MQAILSTIMFIVRLLPVLVELIRQLEVAFPEKGWGKFRLSLFGKIFARFRAAIADGKITSEDNLIEGIVSDVVEAFNAKPEAWNKPEGAIETTAEPNG